jgi:hypothetical protein
LSGFIFQRINLWTGSMPLWTGRACSVHRGPMAAPTEGGWGVVARSPELSLRPLQCAKAHRRGRNRERSAREARPGPQGARAASRRMGDGGEGSAASVLGERVAQAWREGKRSGDSCGETRWGCSPFIGGRGSVGEGWPGSLTPTLMALTPLKTGEGLTGI